MKKPAVISPLLNSKCLFFFPPIFDESAWFQHVPFAYWIIENFKPKTFLELGVHNGVSYFSFCEAVLQNKISTNCIGIDTWKGESHAGLYSEEVYEKFMKNNKKYESFSTIRRGFFEDELFHIKNNSIDLIHIDGFHSYDAVKTDFELAYKKINKKSGIILLHDINEFQPTFGVNKFWDEISIKFKSFEFNHGHGLGVILIGNSFNESIKTVLLDKDILTQSQIRNTFEILGQRILLYWEKLNVQKNLDLCNKSYQQLNKDLLNLQLSTDASISNLSKELNRIKNSKPWKILRLFKKITYPLFRIFLR